MTPGSHDIDDQWFPFEPFVGTAHRLSGNRHAFKRESRIRISDCRRQPWRRRDLETRSWLQHECARPVVLKIEISFPLIAGLFERNGNGLPSREAIELNPAARKPSDEQAVIAVRRYECAVDVIALHPEASDRRAFVSILVLEVNLIFAGG